MQFFIRSLERQPFTSISDGWNYASIMDGAWGGFSRFLIHMSVLSPGVLPHELHSHDDEEIFFVLSGGLEVISGKQNNGELPLHPVVEKNGFVYHSKGYQHTLRAVGGSEGHYLVIRWERSQKISDSQQPFCVIQPQPSPFPKSLTDWQLHPIEQLNWMTENRVRAHYRQMLPGVGYAAHVDDYDVVLILYEGTVEIMDQNVTAPSVAFFASGIPHGLINAANTPANYIVFEMDD